MVSDTVIQRTELSSFNDVLHWADDGSIALNTTGQLTVLTPKYNSQETVKSSNDLFEFNKIDIDKFPSNDLFRTEVSDERTSTLHSSADTSIVQLGWSPLIDQSSILTVLTNHYSLLLIKHNQVWKDLTTTKVFSSQAELDRHIVHSFTWIRLEDVFYLVTGLASGEIRYFKVQNDKLVESSVAKLSENPIVKLKAFGESLVAVSNTNEIIQVEGESIKTISPAQRHLVYDVLLTKTHLVHAQLHKLVKTALKGGHKKEIITGLYTHTKLTLSGTDILLITDSDTKKLTKDFEIVQDNIIEPILSKRLSKWNSKFNDFNTKNFILKVYGYDVNYSGNVLAVFYEIFNNDGFRYKIASENLFKIAYVPLSNNYPTNSSSLAVFQEYKLTGSLNLSEENDQQAISFNGSFDDFLKNYVVQDPIIKKHSAQNLLTRDQDTFIRNRYAELIIQYVKNNSLIFQNQIDTVVYNNLSLISGKNLFDGYSTPIEFRAGAFSESFNFQDNSDLDVLRSTTNHLWPRCSLSFLPILTPFVKVDPVTEKRIIDIERDGLNAYGPFTRSILKLSEISLYSGSHFKTK